MEKEIKNQEYNNENISSTVRMLASILGKTDGFVRHLDTQINILLGISSAVFMFSASQIKNSEWEIFFIIISGFSAMSSIICLCAIHPPKFMRKRGQVESLMYSKKVSAFESQTEYSKELKKIKGNEENIIDEYATEIYNLCKYYYRPKRKLFNVSRNILFA